MQDQKKSSEGYGILGNKKLTQSSAGLMTVKSFHEKPIEITLLDQMPVSGDAELVVTTNAEPAPTVTNVDERPGVVSWTATYAPGEERKVRFGWQATSPEGKTVTGLR